MLSRSRHFTSAVALATTAVLGLAFAPSATSQIGADAAATFAPQLVTVDTPTAEDKAQLLALGLDVTEHAGKDYVEVVLHSANDAALLSDAGMSYDVRIADLIERQRERIALDAAYAEATDVSPLPSGRDTYRVLADFGNEIDALVADNGEIAKRISIGTSVEGRDLTGIEIGVDVNEPEDGRPVFLMFGAHHAREWPSAELPMEFAHDLIAGFNDATHPDHARIVDLLSRGRAIIVPVSNPDGYDASRTSGDLVDLRAADGGGTASILATPGNAYKRKNCRYVEGQTHPAGTCVAVSSNGGLGIGVDLNRNYGAMWGGPGGSGDSTSATYRGPAPFSEPETQAIRSLISSRQVTTLITNHTFSNLILRPVGVNPATIHPDGNPIGFSPDECFTTTTGEDRGAQWLGERMSAQNGYSNQFGWELYDTTGTTEDYSYNATGGYGYTFEIGPDEFHPPYENVVNEYTGDTTAAEGVTADNAADLTTEAGADCGTHEHETVGGGNREAFLIAFENAVDAVTHSLIEGEAPAGATLTLERSGVFPLWDGTNFGDSVATSMVVGDDGTFSWHVNPSTRPFVQSRTASVLGDEIDTLATGGQLTPLTGNTTHDFVVTEPADMLRASVRTTVPVDGQVLNYRQFSLELYAPNGMLVATAAEFGPVNTIAWTGENGTGIEAGTYKLKVLNSLGATLRYDLEAATQDVLGDRTPRRFEQWTLTCITEDGIAGESAVSVERGESVDVGNVCA